MKRIALFGMLLIFAASCEEDILDFTIDNTFEYEYQVSLDENADTTFTFEQIVDANSNDEISNNANNISAFTLNELRYSISQYQGGSNVSGVITLTFYDASNTSLGGSELSISNLMAFASSGESQVLPLANSTINAVQNELLNNRQVKIVADGSVSEVPVEFLSKIFVTVGVTVSP
jgi:hypothetical protein